MSGVDLGAHVTHNANQSISSGVTTVLAFNTERYDVGGLHDTATNNSRLTVPTGEGGKYILTGNVMFAANGTGYREVRFRRNGNANVAAQKAQAISDSGEVTILNLVIEVELAAGDYVEITVTQTSGGSLNVISEAEWSPEFTIRKVDGATEDLGARVTHDTNHSISSDTTTILPFNTERYDVGDFHDTSTNISRLTVPSGQGGKYILTGNVMFAANGTGYREVRFRRNGNTNVAAQKVQAISDSGEVTILNLAIEVELAAGDYVEITVTQTSGGSLNVISEAEWSPEFTIRKVDGAG